MSSMRTLFATTLVAVTSAMALPSHAGFFIPKGTTMVMGTFSPDEQNYEIAYGFDRRVSGAIGLTRVKEGGDTAPWRNVAMTQFAYLLHRQPTSDGIFNAYVWAGPIAARLETANPVNASKTLRKHSGHDVVTPLPPVDNKTRVGAQGGLWVDFETRLIYTRIKAHGFKTEGWRRNEVVAQAMLAPYKADFEDIASWGGVQVKRVSGDKTEITPYVRFFQRNWWIDAGVSVDRAHRDNFFFNFSYTF
jgi:hypothetical protein